MKLDYKHPVVWAAYCSHGRPYPFINEYSIHPRRLDVITDIGNGNRMGSEDWRGGWRRAYREGWRAVKVRVAPLRRLK